MTSMTFTTGPTRRHRLAGLLWMALLRLRLTWTNRRASRRLHTLEPHLLRDMGLTPDQIDGTLHDAMRRQVDLLRQHAL
jgi:uncharacterized protein YjiS (DUF1127 family)